MNEQTKSGLKIGELLTILVGVISLIVVIPTIQNIMSPAGSPIKEYHFKFNNYQGDGNFWGMYLDAQNITYYQKLSLNNFSKYYVYENTTTIILNDDDMALYEISDDSILFFSNDELTSSKSYNYSLSQYGIYDFTNITELITNMTLTPVYTPFS